MKKIIFFLFLPIFLFSQNTDNFRFYEMTSTRVYLNKRVISYNFTTSDYTNGSITKKKEFVNFKKPIPTYIFINSDEGKVSIRINSKYFREDLYYEFQRVYKSDNEDGTFSYDFVGKNLCIAHYYLPSNNDNQFLFIKCLDKNNNGYDFGFTMSKSDQL